MRQQGFYKFDGVLCHATTKVIHRDYELIVDDREQYTLPFDGWYYFEDENSARQHFGLALLKQNKDGDWVEQD
jgi:regulator of RNase E activity RraB